MESVIVSIIVVAIVTMLVTRPGTANTIRQLFSYFTGSVSSVLGTK